MVVVFNLPGREKPVGGSTKQVHLGTVRLTGLAPPQSWTATEKVLARTSYFGTNAWDAKES